jgi:acetyltransferase-like isoleucine patch superfamily enzyme
MEGHMTRSVKSFMVAPLRAVLSTTIDLRESLRRLYAHASLAANTTFPLPASAVVLGCPSVYGTRAVRFGAGVLLYPDLHLETQDRATISIGDGVVLSRGIHIVAMAGIAIGPGTMIGEYTSIRDANHQREPRLPMRDAGYDACPINIGSEVWIGRGAIITRGVTIGDGATVGANAVVTHDVPAGSTVVGVPAVPIRSRSTVSSALRG